MERIPLGWGRPGGTKGEGVGVGEWLGEGEVLTLVPAAVLVLNSTEKQIASLMQLSMHGYEVVQPSRYHADGTPDPNFFFVREWVVCLFR